MRRAKVVPDRFHVMKQLNARLTQQRTRYQSFSGMKVWVNQHRAVIERATGWRVGEKDATDDRLGSLAEVLGESRRMHNGMPASGGTRYHQCVSIADGDRSL